ncbi:hypothetical protein DMENIID0001_110660 [Sergentomyia squamirostris]
MENIENFFQQANRLRSFDFCSLPLTASQKCKLSQKAFFFRISDNTIGCVCSASFEYSSFEETIAHQCATPNDNWQTLNVPVPSPCTEVSDDLASEAFRLETFRTFPDSDNADKEQLAANGFYFDKSPDHITCYACEFGLTYFSLSIGNAIKAHAAFSVYCEPKEKDQNHTITNFLNSEGGKHLVEAGYAQTSIKTVLKQRLSQNLPLTVDGITQDLDHMRKKNKEDESVITTIENLNIDSSITENRDGGLVLDLLNQAQIENENLKESKLCKICLSEDASMAFVPCGHFITCETCSSTVQTCPVCRKHIDKSIKIFQ